MNILKMTQRLLQVLKTKGMQVRFRLQKCLNDQLIYHNLVVLPSMYSTWMFHDFSSGATLWIDGSDETDEQIWIFINTGEMVAWQNHSPLPSNTSRNNMIFDRTSNRWKDASADELHGFVCEAAPGKIHLPSLQYTEQVSCIPLCAVSLTITGHICAICSAVGFLAHS